MGQRVISKKNGKKLKLLWGKVGFIVNLSQMIEYTLANILAFDELLREFKDRDSMFVFEYNEFANRSNEWYSKLSKGTLGYGIKRAKELKFFNDESEKFLTHICEERNFVMHSLFKEDLPLKYLESKPDFYFERLESLIMDMNFANEELNKIFKAQKEEFKLIW